MKPFLQNIRSQLAVVFLLTSTNCLAIPTLEYSGFMEYFADPDNSDPADLGIVGTLVPPDPIDISLGVDLNSSFVSMGANFLSATSTADETTATFGTTSFTDIEIKDGFATASERLLLTANIDTLTMTGNNGSFIGALEGTVSITGGLLATDFGGVGSLLGLSFNFEPGVGIFPFGPDLFNSNFSGSARGSIKGVPEPAPLALLSVGLLGIVLTRKIYRR